MKWAKQYIIKNVSRKTFRLFQRIASQWKYYALCASLILYIYGIVIYSFIASTDNFRLNTNNSTFTLNPIKCVQAVFSPQGLGIAFFLLIMYFLITQKWLHLFTGVKVTKDERNFFVLNEGTHGTSGWMMEQDMKRILLIGGADEIEGPILGKLGDTLDDNIFADYLGLKADNGLNKHIMVYGASGAGKSRGFVKPFILKTAHLKQSMVIVDPKGEFAEQMSEFLRNQGYTVKMFNLLDMQNSDAWNCIGETEGNSDMVQSVAEVIIRNTSDSDQKADFWDKAEMNLLVALILYVQSMRDPVTHELIPIQHRSLGTIYKMLSSEGIKSLDQKFQQLPMDHPARAPYGIFKQAAHNLWGNIFIGLGSRLNVFQNKLVDKITAYHEIDLELPGKQPCAYFCIISDQDSSLEFLSSLFFSLLFKKLSDYARKFGERGRLPVEVNFLLDEFCNVGRILDFKKTISTVRSRGINCQVIIQSAAQLADRYPIKEWQEIVGNCDTQLFLGCNDELTSEFISKRCGNITIQTTSSSSPQTPLFSPITRQVNGYKQTKANATRPLMYPEEILQLDNKECLLLIRGEKPLKARKIIPDELADFKLLQEVRTSDYTPTWRNFEEEQKKTKKTDIGAKTEKKEKPAKTEHEPEQLSIEDTPQGDVAIPSSVDIKTEKRSDLADEYDYERPPVSTKNILDKM